MDGETVGVLSDIHANRPALEAVLDDMPNVDGIVCVGDIVGILGSNMWTVETIREEADHVVFGNHDARVRPEFAYNPSFPSAEDEHRVVNDQLDEDHVEWLSTLSERIETDQFVMGHARPFYFRDPGYPCHGFAQDDSGMGSGEFTTIGPHLDGKTAFLGHTHEQHAVDVDRFPGQEGLVVNPGSVGVPWYSDAEYAVVNLYTQEYDLHSVEYDTDRVRERLADQGTPVGKYSGNDRYDIDSNGRRY